MRKATYLAATVIILLISAFALATVAGANVGGFVVTPVFPENQNPDTRGYFDLRVAPGQRQDLTVIIENTGEEDMIVIASVFTATTNLNGIVDYTAPGQSDESLGHDFSDIATLDYEEMNIPVGGHRELTVSLAVPDEGFDGILLGAINTIREPTKQERAEAGMILNRYSYVIAVRLQQVETPVETDFLLGDVTAELINRRASIVANIRNPQPRLVMGAEASAQIYPVGADTPIFEISEYNVDFAPNSIFPFTMIDDAGYGLRAGDYIVRIQLEHDGKAWEFQREFTILQEVAEVINQGAVNQQQQAPLEEMNDGSGSRGSPPWVMIAAGTGAILLIIVIVLVIMIRRSNHKTYAALSLQQMVQSEQQK